MKRFLMLFLVVLSACTAAPVACPEDAKVCADGTTLVREGPNCEFPDCPEPKKVKCKPADRDAGFCIELYQPVCGWFNDNIQCVTYPCAKTYTNPCYACQDANVEAYSDGQCPLSS